MKTTNKFARLISATEIEFAPTVVVIDGQTIAVNPDSPDAAEIYARCSPRYLPYRDERPTVEPPSYARPVGYEEQGGIVRRVYEIVTPGPQPRTFSKLKLYAALAQAELWDALVAWLNTQTFEGINAYTAFMLAQDLVEDHPMFAQWLAAAKAALSVTDEQAEAILEAAAE